MLLRSLRLAAIPTSSCRHHLQCRIQSKICSPQPTITYSFTTSTTAQRTRIWRTRNYNEDLLSNKKIKKKTKKSLSTDPTLSRDSTGSSGSYYRSQSVRAEILPPRNVDGRNLQNNNSYSGPNGYDRIHGGYTQQQQTGHDRAYQNASRLRNEDILGHHRQHNSYRLRLLQYMRQQKWHKNQQRYQSQGRTREGRQGGDHHQWSLSSWWMWHLIESRKIVVRSLLAGIVVSSGGIWAYNTRSHYLKQWEKFVEDAIRIRDDIRDIVDMTKAMASIRSYSSIPKISSASHLIEEEHKAHISPCVSEDYRGSLKNLRMLSPEQVEIRLGQYQKSFKIMDQGMKNKKERRSALGQSLVSGYSINLLPSNSTIEDDSSQHVVWNENGEVERLFFGVYDGHSGWCCSQKVARELAPLISNELDHVMNLKRTEVVIKAIEQGFLKLDQRIVYDAARRVLEHPSRPLACSSLLPAISGSCALVTYICPKERDLYVACTGDSRAVMGIREPLANGGHMWRAEHLSSDQTGRSRREVKRLQGEHPGEENTVVMSGRVLGGLEPTRAFGDARYKWSKDIQERIFKLFPTYRQPYNNLKTPPYVTAKPVVMHRKIQSEDRFIIMATDGLWDKLTSDEAVQLVGDLLDGKTGHHEMILDRGEIFKQRQKQRKSIQQSTLGSDSSKPQQQQQQQEEEEEKELTSPNTTAEGQKAELRRFTYKDQANASTHLIRNALGGADDDKLSATLSIPSPMSRAYRDDITVTVIFFDWQNTILALSNAEKSGGLVEIH